MPLALAKRYCSVVKTIMIRNKEKATAEAKLYDGRGALVAYASSSCLILS